MSRPCSTKIQDAVTTVRLGQCDSEFSHILGLKMCSCSQSMGIDFKDTLASLVCCIVTWLCQMCSASQVLRCMHTQSSIYYYHTCRHADVYMENSLIDFFVECGSINNACRVFSMWLCGTPSHTQ